METLSLVMETKPRQTIIRMDENLYERLKRAANRANSSLNSFMVSVLEKSVEPAFPKLKLEDYTPDPEIALLGEMLSGATSRASELDEKARYILNKGLER